MKELRERFGEGSLREKEEQAELERIHKNGKDGWKFVSRFLFQDDVRTYDYVLKKLSIKLGGVPPKRRRMKSSRTTRSKRHHLKS